MESKIQISPEVLSQILKISLLRKYLVLSIDLEKNIFEKVAMVYSRKTGGLRHRISRGILKK